MTRKRKPGGAPRKARGQPRPDAGDRSIDNTLPQGKVDLSELAELEGEAEEIENMNEGGHPPADEERPNDAIRRARGRGRKGKGTKIA